MKFDICISTRRLPLPDWFLKQMNILPINKVIIDTSKPLGESRRRLIEQVDTDFLIFIDDDIEISKSWFEDLSKELLKDNLIGCVCGYTAYKGRGKSFDRDFTNDRQKILRKELKLGERDGILNNCIIKTEAVKDWKPTIEGLSSWEDYDVKQHILKENFKVVHISPLNPAIHYVTWLQAMKAQIWSMQGFKKFHLGKERAIMVIKLLVVPIKNIGKFPIRITVANIIYNFFAIIGLVMNENFRYRLWIFSKRRC